MGIFPWGLFQCNWGGFKKGAVDGVEIFIKEFYRTVLFAYIE